MSTESGALDSAQLIDGIYDAVLSPAAWKGVLSEATKAMHARVGILGMGDWQERSFLVPLQLAGMTASEELLALEYAGQKNLYAQAAHQVEFGRVVRAEDLVPIHLLVGTEAYERVMAKYGWHHGAAISLSQAHEIGTFLLFREESAGRFTDRELTLLHTIRPHLLRAVEMLRRLGRPRHETWACHALDRLSAAVFLTNRDSSIVFANQAALAMSGKDGPVHEVKGRLEARTLDQTHRLHRLIYRVVTAHRRFDHDDGVLSLQGSGPEPHEVVVAPLGPSRKTDEWPAACGAMVAVKNAPDEPGPRVAKLFGLTPAESRVVTEINGGCSLKETAERLQVSVNTVRTHLQRIFHKTDTRRQSELVRLLAKLSGPNLGLR